MDKEQEQEQKADFNIDHVITLFDYDKKTEIFSLDIEFEGSIDDVDFSSELLKIGYEIEIFPLDVSLYKIIKINGNQYYLDFK